MALALKEIHPVSHATERQLVRAVRQGDDRAFEQLFSRYRRRISAYVYGLVNDHGRAEDLTQEVFISALRRLRETEGSISFKPWIYEIARNACIDEFRRTSRASYISLDLDPEFDGPPVAQLADHATPEVRWERKQQIGDLFGAFSSLPDNQHRILVLRELEGLSYGEIGARMGMSRPMVESTLFRARRRLTEEYDELASGRRCLEVQAAVDGQETRGLATLGVRERRRIARHLHYCQECLRHARLAGVDDAALRVPGPARRVAALLPFGWLRLAWHRGAPKLPGRGGGAARTAHRASRLAHGAPQSAALGRAAAAAAALVVTGGGVSVLANQHRPLHPNASATPAAAPAFAPAGGENAVLQVPSSVSQPASRRSASATSAAHTRAASARHSAAGRAALNGRARGSTGRGAAAPAAPVPSTPVSAHHGSAAKPPSGLSGVLGTAPAPVRTPLSTIVNKTTGTVGTVLSKVPGTVATVTAPLSGGVTVPNPGVALPGVSVPGLPLPGAPSVTTPSVTVPGPAGDVTVVPSVKLPPAGGVTTPSVSLPTGAGASQAPAGQAAAQAAASPAKLSLRLP